MTKLTEITTTLTQLGNTDLILASSNTSGNAVSVVVQFQNLFANVAVDVEFTANVSLGATSTAPTDSSDFTGKTGTIFFDEDYLYISTSGTNVKRIALNSF